MESKPARLRSCKGAGLGFAFPVFRKAFVAHVAVVETAYQIVAFVAKFPIAWAELPVFAGDKNIVFLHGIPPSQPRAFN